MRLSQPLSCSIDTTEKCTLTNDYIERLHDWYYCELRLPKQLCCLIVISWHIWNAAVLRGYVLEKLAQVAFSSISLSNCQAYKILLTIYIYKYVYLYLSADRRSIFRAFGFQTYPSTIEPLVLRCPLSLSYYGSALG